MSKRKDTPQERIDRAKRMYRGVVKVSKTAFFKEVVTAVREAGCELIRRNNSHEIFKTPDNRRIIIPRKLDDPRIAYRIIKQAGAKL